MRVKDHQQTGKLCKILESIKITEERGEMKPSGELRSKSMVEDVRAEGRASQSPPPKRQKFLIKKQEV